MILRKPRLYLVCLQIGIFNSLIPPRRVDIIQPDELLIVLSNLAHAPYFINGGAKNGRGIRVLSPRVGYGWITELTLASSEWLKRVK